jgi:hypothetical protein
MNAEESQELHAICKMVSQESKSKGLRAMGANDINLSPRTKDET